MVSSRSKVTDHQFIENWNGIKDSKHFFFFFHSIFDLGNIFDILFPHLEKLILELLVWVNPIAISANPNRFWEYLIIVILLIAGQVEKGKSAIKTIAISFDCDVHRERLLQKFQTLLKLLIWIGFNKI